MTESARSPLEVDLDDTTPAVVTSHITVPCSYCEDLVTVPFRHGAVMPLKERDAGVAVFIPTLTGSDHECSSERHRRERDWWERGVGRYIPVTPGLTAGATDCGWCPSCVVDRARFMVVCPDCGNKRCPKATHHDNPCTGSNDPGQIGSRYA